MRRSAKHFLLSAALILVASQPMQSGGEEHGESSEEWAAGEVGRPDKDLKVPKALVEEIEGWFIAERRAANKVLNESDKEIMRQLQRQGLELEIDLKPSGSGHVLEQGVRFQVPASGGSLDLAKVIPDSRGTFHMQFKVKDDEGAGRIRVFYLSNAVRRQVFDQDHGAGCDKWMELTSWFMKQLKKPLELAATEQSYVSVVSGVWIFAVLKDTHLNMATLNISDSRFPRRLCQAVPNL